MIRANAVEVARIFQARCRVPGCPWTGGLRGTYQAANGERQVHLAWHQAHEPEVAP